MANWGNYPKMDSQLFFPESIGQVQPWLPKVPSLIPRGNGRCYGDAALANIILETLAFRNVLDFDQEKGYNAL